MSGDLISRVKKRSRDRVAGKPDRTVPHSTSTTAPVPVAGLLTGGLDRLLEAGRDHDPLGGQAVPEDVSTALRSRRGSGAGLPSGLAAVAGRHLGQDLSGVRVHTDAGADTLARSVQAQAFTQGSDIYFSKGSYDPDSAAGSHLLAHELAHVAQGSHGAGPVIGRADDPVEAAADRMADRIAPALRHLQPGPSVDGPAATQGSGSLHRKISKTGRDIDALRSERGQKKGARTNDTLHRIGKLIDNHVRLDKQEKVIASLDVIMGLCRHWLAKHAKTKNTAMVTLVNDILDEAHRDWGVAKAQATYINDARAGSAEVKNGVIPMGHGAPLTFQPTSHALMMGIGDAGIKKASGTDSLRLDSPMMKPGPMNAQANRAYMIKMAGLTEAEVLAISKFSSGDFTYINPAMESQVRHQVDGRAESGGWMRSQMTAIQKSVNHADKVNGNKPRGVGYDQLVQEGTLHAGVAMQGLSKLKPLQGMVFRGERMSRADFDKVYAGSSTTTFHSFKSMTTNRETAERYSVDGVLGNEVRADQTLSVLCIFEVNDARDIKPFSEIPAENEWLILPGSTFQLNGIREVAKGKQPGRTDVPPVSEWKVVRLRQRPGRPTGALPRGK